MNEIEYECESCGETKSFFSKYEARKQWHCGCLNHPNISILIFPAFDNEDEAFEIKGRDVMRKKRKN